MGMGCEKCRDLPRTIELRSPADLRAAIALAATAIAEGRLREVPAEGVPGNVPFSVLATGGPWDDFVQYAFKCTGCGNHFRVAAETYHGSGGAWQQG
jgi:hypothetical protein